MVSWLVTLFLQPRLSFTFATRAHCSCSSHCLPASLGLFQPCCFPAGWCPACITARDFSFPSAALCELCQGQMQSSCWPTSPTCLGLLGWQLGSCVHCHLQQMLCCFLHVKDKGIKEDVSQKRLLQYSACDWPSAGAQPIKSYPLSPSFQQLFNFPSVQLCKLRCLDLYIRMSCQYFLLSPHSQKSTSCFYVTNL